MNPIEQPLRYGPLTAHAREAIARALEHSTDPARSILYNLAECGALMDLVDRLLGEDAYDTERLRTALTLSPTDATGDIISRWAARKK